MVAVACIRMSAKIRTPLGAWQRAKGKRGLHRQAAAIACLHAQPPGGKARDLAFPESP